MKRFAARIAVSLLLPLALAALPLPAGAAKQPVDPQTRCQELVKKKMKSKHPGARDIQLTQTRTWQQSSKQSGYGGTGTVLTTKNETGTFEWTCTYDTTTNKVLSVEFQKEGKPTKTK